MKRFAELDADVDREMEGVGLGFAHASEEEMCNVKRLKRAEMVEAFAIGAEKLCDQQRLKLCKLSSQLKDAERKIDAAKERMEITCLLYTSDAADE